jgi:peptidoglycan hydrolase-like protein with peptidoglycan-binding domain
MMHGTTLYPEGLVTGYFGAATKRAVIRFQEKYAADILKPWGLARGTGIVAKTTAAKLCEM